MNKIVLRFGFVTVIVFFVFILNYLSSYRLANRSQSYEYYIKDGFLIVNKDVPIKHQCILSFESLEVQVDEVIVQNEKKKFNLIDSVFIIGIPDKGKFVINNSSILKEVIKGAFNLKNK